MLGITMLLDISARLTHQVTRIICHDMKKILLKKKEKKYKNMRDQTKTHMLTKTIHRQTIPINKEF